MPLYVPNMRVFVGTYTTVTTTGSVSVTGVGFQPKIVFTFGSMDGATTAPVLGIGAATPLSSTAHYLGVRTTTEKGSSAAVMFTLVDADGTVYKSFTLVSFDADGFTFSRDTNTVNAYTMSYVLLG